MKSRLTFLTLGLLALPGLAPLAEAQRFGYKTDSPPPRVPVPRGAYVIPPPAQPDSRPPAPVKKATPAPKPVVKKTTPKPAAKPAAKPAQVAKTTSKPKTSSGKSTATASSSKKASTPTKAVASTKTPAKPAAKPTPAKTEPKPVPAPEKAIATSAPAPEKPKPAQPPVTPQPEIAAAPPVPVPSDPRKRPAAEVVAAILNGKLDPAKLPPPPKHQPEPAPQPAEPGIALRIGTWSTRLPQRTLEAIAAAAAQAPDPAPEPHAPPAVVNLSDPPRAGQQIPELPGAASAPPEPPAPVPHPAEAVAAGPSRPIVIARTPPPTPAVIPPPAAPVIRPEPIPAEAFALNDKPAAPVLTDLMDFPPDARETARLTASTTPVQPGTLEASPENLELTEPELPAAARPRVPEPALPTDPDDSHFAPSELALLRNMSAKLPPSDAPAPDKIPAANAIDTALKRLPDSVPADAIDTARKALNAVATAGPAREEIVAAVRQIREQAPDRLRDAAATLAQAKDAARDLLPRQALEVRNDLTPASPEPLPESLPPGTVDARLGRIDIQSDRQADFDQANNKVIFTGKVQLNSPTLRLRASRVEVFMKKNGQGMARVEASGDVILQLQPTPDARPTMASAGRAVYDPESGEMALYDWPKIQEPNKSHIATEASTKMKLFTDGRMTTEGANRTIIGGL